MEDAHSSLEHDHRLNPRGGLKPFFSIAGEETYTTPSKGEVNGMRVPENVEEGKAIKWWGLQVGAGIDILIRKGWETKKNGMEIAAPSRHLENRSLVRNFGNPFKFNGFSNLSNFQR